LKTSSFVGFIIHLSCCHSFAQSSQIKVDPVHKTYSNYEHGIGVNLPDHWELDYGISKHTILRGFEADSGYTFTINVVKLDGDDAKIDKSKEKPIDYWSEYLKNRKAMDEGTLTALEKSLNTKVRLIKSDKSYIKQRICLRQEFKYIVKELDLEYENTMIMFRYATTDRVFTITLTIPTLFFAQNPTRFEDIFLHVHFP